MESASVIRLLQFTDMHLLGEREATLRGVCPYDTLRATQHHARRHVGAVDAVLLTGDLVNDEAGGYALLREAFAHSSVSLHCIPGNHDLPDSMHSSLASAPFSLAGHALYGNWLIVLLDSWLEGSAAGELGEEELHRLDALLTMHPDHHALLCLHHHPLDMHSAWLDQVGLKDAAALRACIKRHPRVRGVLWGHVHQTFEETHDGVRYLATPATCAQFLPRSDTFAVDTRPPAYRLLELHDNGRIDTRVIWVDNITS